MAINPALATVSFIPPENLLGNSPILSSMRLAELGQRCTGSKLCFRAQELISISLYQALFCTRDTQHGFVAKQLPLLSQRWASCRKATLTKATNLPHLQLQGTFTRSVAAEVENGSKIHFCEEKRVSPARFIQALICAGYFSANAILDAKGQLQTPQQELKSICSQTLWQAELTTRTAGKQQQLEVGANYCKTFADSQWDQAGKGGGGVASYRPFGCYSTTHKQTDVLNPREHICVLLPTSASENMEGIAHLGGEEAGIPAAELCFSTLRSFNQREDRPKKDKSTSKSKHLPERSVYTESARWPYKMLNNHNCPPSKGERSASQGYMARDIVPPEKKRPLCKTQRQQNPFVRNQETGDKYGSKAKELSWQLLADSSKPAIHPKEKMGGERERVQKHHGESKMEMYRAEAGEQTEVDGLCDCISHISFGNDTKTIAHIQAKQSPAETNSVQAVQLRPARASGAHRWLNAFDISLQGLQQKSLPAVAGAPDSSESRLVVPSLCVHTLLLVELLHSRNQSKALKSTEVHHPIDFNATTNEALQQNSIWDTGRSRAAADKKRVVSLWLRTAIPTPPSRPEGELTLLPTAFKKISRPLHQPGKTKHVDTEGYTLKAAPNRIQHKEGRRTLLETDVKGSTQSELEKATSEIVSQGGTEQSLKQNMMPEELHQKQDKSRQHVCWWEGAFKQISPSDVRAQL
ncbi:hypothetical protein Anapl_17406 [Anas platyrhynchos]|uniref:Uncharacterized protein n=1 Tax=Anas platyrhynchos TaxID=8839 RepID=R0JRP4_ANAPL|nr:hypothetical protein Anapl_17406 [Anas platyrhynchos]